MTLRLGHPLRPFIANPVRPNRPIHRSFRFAAHSGMVEPSKLVLEVKEKLEREYYSLSIGKNRRDDEDMIYWFLKDKKFSVDDTVMKLTKAIKWRQEFKVSELSDESVEGVAKTGKAYVHDFLDVNNRPVLVVVAAKHFPAWHDPIEDEKLCLFA